MAVTIEQKPNPFSGFRQRNNIVVASSTNTAQDGFKYKVTIEAGGKQWYQGYVSPNPADALIFDLYPILSQIGSMVSIGSGNTVHKFSSSTRTLISEVYPGTSFTYEDEPVTVTVDEAWIVNGILTDNPDIHAADSFSQIFINRSPQWSDGFNPNPNTSFFKYDTTSGPTLRMMTDRTWETLKWDLSESIALGAPSNTRMYVRTTKNDWGVWSIPYTSQADKSANGLSNYAATKMRVTLLPLTGSTITYTEDLASLDPDDGVLHFGVYPGNIRASTIGGLSTIQGHLNADTWKAMWVTMLNASDATVSMIHIMYNAALYGGTDCRYDNVRLGWLNTQGGWDYFNFTKRNENNYQIERKQFKSIPGNYALANGDSTAFNIYNYERGVTQTQGVTQRYIEITSDWLTEGEFVLMTSLITSPDVYIIDTLGNATAVVIDRNDYTEKKERNGKKYNVTLRLRYAQDYWV
jgi:hypothetical protein